MKGRARAVVATNQPRRTRLGPCDQRPEEVAETLTRNIADARKRLADTQAQVDTPFEYAERLASLVQRQQEIEDELDLSKNQASVRLEADAPEAPSIDQTEGDSLREDYDEDWF